MAFSSLLFIIAVTFLIGGLLGYSFRPAVRFCVHVWRRLFFRPKFLTEFKLGSKNEHDGNSPKSES